MNFHWLRHRARPTKWKRPIKAARAFAVLQTGSICNTQTPTPSKLKGGGIKGLLYFHALVFKKREVQETYSCRPQFKNQTVYMSRCNKSHYYKVGGGTQTQRTQGGIALFQLLEIRHWLTATPSARPIFCSKSTSVDFISRFASHSKI